MMLRQFVLEKNAINAVLERLNEAHSSLCVDAMYQEVLMFSVTQYQNKEDFLNYINYLAFIYFLSVSKIDNEMCRFCNLDDEEQIMYIEMAAMITYKERNLLSRVFHQLSLPDNFKIRLRYAAYVMRYFSAQNLQ